jgi:hypothetical protein
VITAGQVRPNNCFVKGLIRLQAVADAIWDTFRWIAADLFEPSSAVHRNT